MSWSTGLPQIVGTTTSISASYFGFKPGVDNTAAWAAFATWLAGLVQGERYSLQLGPGTYYADSIELLKPINGGTAAAVEICGAGMYDTILIPNSSAAPVFFTIDAAYMLDVKLRSFGISGIGSTNPNQDGLAVVAMPRSFDNTGGMTFGEFSRLRIENFDGRQMWMRGSQQAAGPLGSLLPNQFLTFDDVFFKKHVGVPSFESGGQFGQVKFKMGSLGGDSTATGGPVAIFADEPRAVVLQPVSVELATDDVSASTHVYYAPCTEFRIVGSNLPTGLSKGVTYFIDTVARGGSSPDGSKFSLHTSRLNAAAGTKFNFTNAGTPANWMLVPLWAIALSSSEFTTEFSHRLLTGDKLRFRGSSLPSGAIGTTTDWYVIRTGHRSLKLASSVANALAGTVAVMSAGTLSEYGFVLNDGTASGLSGAYSVDLDGTSVEGSQLAVFLLRARDIRLRLHVEETRRAIEVCDSTVTVVGGLYANAAGASGNGVWIAGIGSNSVIAITGMPYLNGQLDKLYTAIGADVRVSEEGLAFAGTPPAVQSTGMTLQQSVSFNAIDIFGRTRIFVNASASSIKNITSKHGVGARISILAFGGSITLDSSGTGVGTIRLPTSMSPTVLIPDSAVAVLEMWDTVGTWILVSKSA